MGNRWEVIMWFVQSQFRHRARAQKLSLSLATNLHYLRAPANISGQIDKKIYKAVAKRKKLRREFNFLSFTRSENYPFLMHARRKSRSIPYVH
jgi:hypothetical protein